MTGKISKPMTVAELKNIKPSEIFTNDVWGRILSALENREELLNALKEISTARDEIAVFNADYDDWDDRGLALREIDKEVNGLQHIALAAITKAEATL